MEMNESLGSLGNPKILWEEVRLTPLFNEN